MLEPIKILCGCFWSSYYLFHCCAFGSSYIREKYMNNNCTEFFKKKYNDFFDIEYQVIQE